MTDYLTADEAQRWVGAPIDELTGEVDATITAVSAMIDNYCDRSFGRSDSQARDFIPVDSTVVQLGPFDDLVSVSSITEGDTFTTPVTGYLLEPHNPAVGSEVRPYRAIRRTSGTWTLDVTPTVRVTGVWGWPAVPAPVKAACRIQVARVFKRNESPLGVAGFGEFGVVRVPSQLDPDVRQMLDPYRILAGFA